jgi:hypothetical protein
MTACVGLFGGIVAIDCIGHRFVCPERQKWDG